MKRILAFYCCSEHDHAFIWYVLALLVVENLHLSELEFSTEFSNTSDGLTYFLFSVFFCPSWSNPGELGKSKTTSLPLPTGPFMHHSFYGLTHLFWPRLWTPKSRPWPWPSKRLKLNRGETNQLMINVFTINFAPKLKSNLSITWSQIPRYLDRKAGIER